MLCFVFFMRAIGEFVLFDVFFAVWLYLVGKLFVFLTFMRGFVFALFCCFFSSRFLLLTIFCQLLARLHQT